ncbi:hypothetical protein FOPE_04513 [Fonsecaea pedrosoi]|nr:hypothetical protein FOPE_04513 [Fonsecaea pedrosoi]
MAKATEGASILWEWTGILRGGRALVYTSTQRRISVSPTEPSKEIAVPQYIWGNVEESTGGAWRGRRMENAADRLLLGSSQGPGAVSTEFRVRGPAL